MRDICNKHGIVMICDEVPGDRAARDEFNPCKITH
jgi:glutamate-1-semialdehyde aminotransferase